jgi:hypothetical protein
MDKRDMEEEGKDREGEATVGRFRPSYYSLCLKTKWMEGECWREKKKNTEKKKREKSYQRNEYMPVKKWKD